MWWLDPGKEVLNVLFNRILAPYVENLDLNQVGYGIAQGQLTLHNLRLKKGVLDKFQLPVDVIEGHLGTFTLSLHWMNLGNQPVEILIEDVYLLVVPSPQTNVNAAEEEARKQAAKAERLESAELLHVRGGAEAQSDSPQTQGLIQSLITKVINNVQVTIKNIHVRYEDDISVPGHPFAAGVTLENFSAVSVDGEWKPSFIESTAGAIHKLAKLECLAIYFDTNSQSMAGLPQKEAIARFSEMIRDADGKWQHQYILKPVSGEGRVVVNHRVDRNTPRFNVELLFDEIGVSLDDHQYSHAISLVDMYQVFMRKQQYKKFLPAELQLTQNVARARLQFAANAILSVVHEKNRKWTWAYFAERRDDRNKYVGLFQKKLLGPLLGEDLEQIQALEKKLSYEDLRFYRSIGRSRMRKDQEKKKRIDEERKKEQSQKQGWGAWLWGSGADSGAAPKQDPLFNGEMTEEQRKQLYDVLDYDEKSSLMEALEAPRDSLKMQVNAKLKRGSLTLKTDPHGDCKEALSVVFDIFNANLIQRPGNFEATVSLQDFKVFDGTTPNTLYPQIVRVKQSVEKETTVHIEIEGREEEPEANDPFFFVKFENNPLDDRADNAITARMRHMEIIYHKGYVEAIYKFFKPPASQLESVEALLNVASETFEGLRKETRAGLEYALQTHKTVDLHVDMNAPIIIIPEDITTNQCSHLILDAGHISIESDLADKKAVQTVYQKRNQKYNDEDYRELESLMYDKMSLKLQDAQFVIGRNLQSCLDALTGPSKDNLHLLERININFQIQKSIVPTAVNLSQIKVAGDLPSLQVNLSDAKYHSLMKLVDVAIPKFDKDVPVAHTLKASDRTESTTRYHLPSTGLFAPFDEVEYNVSDDDDDSDDGAEDEFFEADGGLGQVALQAELHQRSFELEFHVGVLRAALSKSTADGERPLGELTLQQFALNFGLAKFTMEVDVNLRSVSLALTQASKRTEVVTTPAGPAGESTPTDLLRVKYVRAQRDSPEFESVYEGINQTADVKLSTLVFQVEPEPILAVYDFIMTTFVPSFSQPPTPQVETAERSLQATSVPEQNDGKIRVLVKLQGVQVVFVNESEAVATLDLSVGDVSILTRATSLRVSGRLGSLVLVNNNKSYGFRPDFNQLLSIEGENFADFIYQTFDPNDESYAGVKSSIRLNAASLKFNYLEEPLRDMYAFLTKLARLKYLYDAARTVAVQTASEMDRMQFAVSIRSPILVFPSDPTTLSDVVIMRLGHIDAKNSFDSAVTKTSASLHGIKLVSSLQTRNGSSQLKIIDDINVDAEVIQTTGIDRNVDLAHPDMQVSVKLSDIRLHLTQTQYVLLMTLSKSIPRIFAGVSGNAPGIEGSKLQAADSHFPQDSGAVSLQPELRSSPSGGSRPWTALDLVVSISAVKLHLYDENAASEDHLKEHGIARFALNDNNLRLKQLSDGSLEAQVVLKSFTMSNIRPGPTKFREIIPAAQHERNQFMILYTSSGTQSTTGPNSLAILTIDSPQVIFAVDPIFALLQFFTSPFPSQPEVADPRNLQGPSGEVQAQPSSPPTLDFRVDLHDVSVSILENETDAQSRAIRLHVSQVLFSQQGIIALTVTRLGMSLMRMGRYSEVVRFLDNLDLTVSLDNRSSTSQQMSNIEISVKPVVLRASYRDINLITSIVNRAVELYSSSQQHSTVFPVSASDVSSPIAKPGPAGTSVGSPGTGTLTQGKATVLMSKEQLKASLDGFRLILIGDLHEQPMLHLKVKPFIIGAKDWSGALRATTTLASQMTYWNLTNSHWEPLIDPWTFTISVSKDSAAGATHLSVNARERLDVNLSTTFAEVAISTLNSWSKEGDVLLSKPRGAYAPYRIRNRTGTPLFIFSDVDSGVSMGEGEMTKVLNNHIIDWRFDDWKTMREHVSSGQHNIGIRFAEKSWEQLRGIPVDREGEYAFTLRPRTEKYPARLLCEVRVVDNVKIVTIRSTYLVENSTLYPLELMLVDEHGQPAYSLERIVPGQDFALPVEVASKYRIRLQPDQGFGYRWCSPIRWEDLVARKSFAIKCAHGDSKEAAFRFQAWVQTDAQDLAAGKYPKIKLKLRAPLELENLLPYNIEYRIYDKNTDQNWKSYLRKGGIMPIHSVELNHFILLNVAIQDSVFKPSDFAIINTDGHSDFDIEKQVVLRDQNNRKLSLGLNFVKYPDSGGAFKVQIYSPYVVINKTGLPFSVRATRSSRGNYQDVAGPTQADVLSSTSPFLLSHSHPQGSEFVFQFAGSSWSKIISLEAPSAETELVTGTQKNSPDRYYMGVSWAEGQGKYKISKVITLSPRFLIRNHLPESISYREHGVIPRERSVITPGGRGTLSVLRLQDEKLLTIAYPGLNAQWSSPINLEDIGVVYLRLKRATPEGNNAMDLIRAEIMIEASTIFVILSKSDEWPFEIENDTDYSFKFSQRDNARDPDRPRQVYDLPSRSKTRYAWDFPAAKEKRILLSTSDIRRVVDIMEIGDLVPFKFQQSKRTKAVSLDVRAEGQKQILRITDYNPERSLYKPQRSNTLGPVTRQDTVTGSMEGFEAVTEEIQPLLTFTLDLAGVGISLVNRRLVEVIYATFDQLKFEYVDSSVAQAVTLSCGSLQIDNQLHDALFPVIMQPTPISKEASDVGALPTVQASVIWLKDQAHGVFFIKYCSILLQALTVEADEDLLFAIYDLTQIKGLSWEDESQDVLNAQGSDIPDPTVSTTGQVLYFEVLELQPILLSISFMRAERVSSEEKMTIRNPLAVVLNAVTMAVGNINDAQLEMNALAIKDMRLSTTDLQNRIFYHYRQEVLRQLYRILGSADFIGNPVGLFTNVSSGVADIFYEPFQGVVMHGNRELGIGIAKGAASFVKKTVFGLSDSVTKFTSSVGKGLSAATFDSEYQAKRRMTQRRNRPRHAIYGFSAGGEALASSVTSAMEGVFMKPIEGAETEGAFGFFKGVGKGLVGAVTKPVVGVFDLAANVSEGIRNTTTVFDNPDRDRVRMPRLVPADGVLKSYSAREALGQYWMKDLNDGAYRKELYVAHINSPGGDNVVLLTQSMVLSFYSKRLRLDWELPFTQIQGVTAEDNGIRFAHRLGRESDKFAIIPDKASQTWFFNQVAAVVKQFNARRRMD